MTIVDVLDERADLLSGVTNVAIERRVALFVLERLHEALRLCIVIRIGKAAHAGDDAMGVEQHGVVATCVLHAAVGMMHETSRPWASRRDRHLQRGDWQARVEVRLQSSAYDPSAEGIEHHGQICELFAHAHIGDVGPPKLVDACRTI